jgi:GMP synthase (glutamine-hydrolysing)
MKPFLFLQARPEKLAADNEYAAFLKFSGLNKEQLQCLAIHSGVIPRLDIDNFSGFILGGSPYNSSDPPVKKSAEQQKCEAWLFNLMDKIVEHDLPFLGSCYGVGIIGTHQGGKISRIYGEVAGGVSIKLTRDSKSDNLLKGLPPSFQAFVGHKEACEVLPKNAVLLASSDSCPVQMFRIKNNIYAVQFHTELDAEGLAVRVRTYKNAGYFPPEEADALIAMAYQQTVTEPEKILRRFTEIYSR